MKVEINQTKIKGGGQSGGKVVTHNSKSDLPLSIFKRFDIKPMRNILFLMHAT